MINLSKLFLHIPIIVDHLFDLALNVGNSITNLRNSVCVLFSCLIGFQNARFCLNKLLFSLFEWALQFWFSSSPIWLTFLNSGSGCEQYFSVRLLALLLCSCGSQIYNFSIHKRYDSLDVRWRIFWLIQVIKRLILLVGNNYFSIFQHVIARNSKIKQLLIEYSKNSRLIRKDSFPIGNSGLEHSRYESLIPPS